MSVYLIDSLLLVPSMKMVKMACDRLLTEFILVAAVARLEEPRTKASNMSAGEAMGSSVKLAM